MALSPRRVVVSKIVTSRYPGATRPTSWDERHGGVDTVVTESGERIDLYSTGGQSTPAPGWEILLMADHADTNGRGTTWTLYGIKPTR